MAHYSPLFFLLSLSLAPQWDKQRTVKMEESPATGGAPPATPAPAPAIQNGKSCKGCLYYSSLLKSQARNPICFGISRNLPQVPDYIVGESELEAAKEGRNLSDFKYSCVGYSVFLDNNKDDSDKRDNQADLPFCVGLELLVDKRSSTEQVPVHSHNKEAKSRVSETIKPRTISTDDFFGKFVRNAGLVASGVNKNLNKIGNYVKETMDDILYPYRKRPK